jgi:hypothetical protein
MSRYWKFIVAIVGTVAITVQTALTDGTVTQAEVVTIVISAITAIGVYLKANHPVNP